MKKSVIIGVLVMLSQTLYCQKSDSTKLIPVPKWKLDRLLDSFFYDLPSCNKTVVSYVTALDSLKFTLEQSKKLADTYLLQRDNKATEAELLRKQAKETEAIHKQELKQAKKKGFKAGSITTGIIAILLITITL